MQTPYPYIEPGRSIRRTDQRLAHPRGDPHRDRDAVHQGVPQGLAGSGRRRRREVAMNEMVLSADSRQTAGILLLTVVAVELGGAYMLRIVRGRTRVTGFQQAFARAGHAHAGVLVIL